MKSHRIPLSKERLTELGFSDFYYYHRSFFWKWFLSVLAIGAFGLFTLNYLLDSNFQIMEHLGDFRCYGSGKSRRGCVLAKLIYAAALIFFTLPIWIKLPSAIVIAINSIFGFSKKLIHYYDQKPDFAVGDAGVYCPDWFHYQEINWSEIKHIEIKSRKTEYGSLISYRVEIELNNKNLADLSLFEPTERKLKVSATWKLATADIIQALKKFGTNTKFVEFDEIVQTTKD